MCYLADFLVLLHDTLDTRLDSEWMEDVFVQYRRNDPGFKLNSEQTESICQEKRTTGNLVVLFLFFILRRLVVVVVVVVVQDQE